MPVQLYTKSKCPQCDATVKILDREGVEYESISLDNNPEALDFVTKLGHRSAPVVYANEDNHWSGFRPDLIAQIPR